MTFTAEQLRTMLAEAEQAEQDDRAAAVASDRLTAVLAAAVQQVADLAAAGAAAGLVAPDPAALVAAALTRATPVAPDVLVSIVAPEPVAPVAPVARTAKRRSVERDYTAVPRGSHWTCRLSEIDGKVEIYPNVAAGTASFRPLTGPDAGKSFDSPSRAVQAATGYPVGKGRNGEATVNGWVALKRDGRSLADVAAIRP